MQVLALPQTERASEAAATATEALTQKRSASNFADLVTECKRHSGAHTGGFAEPLPAPALEVEAEAWR